MLSKIEEKEIILKNREYFLKKEKFVKRGINIEGIISNPQISVITGIRRCGKSVLLKLIQKTITDGETYYLNFNDPKLIDTNISDIIKLFENYFEMFPSEKKYIFLDEVQEIKGWHKLILEFYEEKYKVIITGSNGNLLSKDIATYLTGRQHTITLFPFSFKEYLMLKNISIDTHNKSKKELIHLKKAFKEYIQNGGFPQVIQQENTQLLKEYFESILYKDVIVRNKVSYAKELKELAFYIISNNTKISSYKKLRETIQVKSLSTIKEYLDYLENSYIILQLPKYEYSIRTQIRTSKKLYSIDTGLINEITFKTSTDEGRLLENSVFLELKRKQKEIYYHNDKYECNFIIKTKNKITQAIQVSLDLSKTETKKRELNGLMDALNKYKLKEGTILTEDEEDEITIEKKKIKIIPVWKWLLNNKLN